MDDIQLAWDLHVHPGPSTVPRWADGRGIVDAGLRAGIRGFVWKSHEMHTHDLARALRESGLVVIGSASMNSWATLESAIAAVEGGAAWVWGPTRSSDGSDALDLELPAWSSEFFQWLKQEGRSVVVATGHLGHAGRRAIGEVAADAANITCSVTHSLGLESVEWAELASLGCYFEMDLYTAVSGTHRASRDALVDAIRRRTDAGYVSYISSDAGQLGTGDPYVFTREVLKWLADRVGRPAVFDLATTVPERLVGTVTDVAL